MMNTVATTHLAYDISFALYFSTFRVGALRVQKVTNGEASKARSRRRLLLKSRRSMRNYYIFH